MRKVVAIGSLVGVFALLVTPSVVSAQEASAKERQAAAEAYDKGSTAYLAEDWATAAQWFETAHRMAPASAALLQAIRAHEHAENFARAATLSALLVEEYPSDTQAVGYAQKILDEQGPHLLRVEVVCDECQLDLDGTLEEHKTFYVDADSTYTLTADFETGKRTAHVAGLPGDTQRIVLTAPTEQTPVVTPPIEDDFAPATDDRSHDDDWRREDPSRDERADDGPPFAPIVAWIGVGLTGALAVASVVSTIDMMGGVNAYDEAADEANTACTSQPQRADCPQRYDDAQELLTEGQNKETRSTILWTATGVVAAGTLAIALFLTDWDGGSSSASVDFGPTHATATFATKF